MIIKTLVVGPFATNCYIVGSELTKRGIIIDPGAEAGAIVRAVDKLGLSIPLIVVTHTHVDHIGALQAVKDETKAEFAVHQAESENKLQACSWMLSPLVGGSFQLPPKPDKLLRDGDIISVDDLSFSALHTPGHSPGGISLSGHGVVFSGDTLFNFGIGRTDFPGCSHQRLMKSIYDKLLVLPDETVVYPGHGPPTTIGAERKANPFLR